MFVRYLLADEAEAAVLPDALVRLPQHRVERLVSVPERRRGVTRDGKGSNVNLKERNQYMWIILTHKALSYLIVSMHVIADSVPTILW